MTTVPRSGNVSDDDSDNDDDHDDHDDNDDSPSFSNPVSPVTNSAPAPAVNTAQEEEDPFSDPFASERGNDDSDGFNDDDIG